MDIRKHFPLRCGAAVCLYQRASDAYFSRVSCHKLLEPGEEWLPPQLPKALDNVSQDDPELVRCIYEDWLLPPFTGERKLQHPEREDYSQSGQSEFIDKLLNNKTNVFFIESGAANGEQLSNSLFFEKSRNWTGLLMEANPHSFRSLLKTRRHAYMVNACLSPTTSPAFMTFRIADLIGGLPQYMVGSHQTRIKQNAANITETIQVQCLPLYSILKAIGVTYIDDFSLDIEGAELEVLYTLPLDKITIDVFSIKYLILKENNATRNKLLAITQHLVDLYGYRFEEVRRSTREFKCYGCRTSTNTKGLKLID